LDTKQTCNLERTKPTLR